MSSRLPKGDLFSGIRVSLKVDTLNRYNGLFCWTSVVDFRDILLVEEWIPNFCNYYLLRSFDFLILECQMWQCNYCSHPPFPFENTYDMDFSFVACAINNTVKGPSVHSCLSVS